MEYRRFGKTDLWLSGLGFGMNRFPPEMLTEEGIQQAVRMVTYAVDRGVNYIDVARNYSDRKAFPILRKALEEIGREKEVYVSVKMMLNHTDRTREGAVQDIREQLGSLGIKTADLCFAQAVKSYEEYQEIMKPGGIYEGFVEARKEGLIRHICLSSHATVEETLQIMEENKFDGYTISYHLLNCVQMRPVLEKAEELGAGVLTMNSLAGGLIPQNPQLFQKLTKDTDEICRMAIQYIYSHPGVTSVLSGMQTLEEMECNIRALEQMETYRKEYTDYFEKELYQKNGLCTGCDYCKGCPKGIPVKSLMYSYNVLQWDNSRYAKQYQREDKNLLDNIRLTQEMMHYGVEFPLKGENPCISCRSCERKCTQSLPVIDRIQDIYERISGRVTEESRWREKLEEIKAAEYQRVVFYPNCGTTRKLLRDYREAFGLPGFRAYVIDRNGKLWGDMEIDGEVAAEVTGPDQIERIQPDVIILTHYMLADVLYHNVAHYREQGVEIKKLYEAEDVPIVYLGG